MVLETAVQLKLLLHACSIHSPDNCSPFCSFVPSSFMVYLASRYVIWVLKILCNSFAHLGPRYLLRVCLTFSPIPALAPLCTVQPSQLPDLVPSTYLFAFALWLSSSKLLLPETKPHGRSLCQMLFSLLLCWSYLQILLNPGESNLSVIGLAGDSGAAEQYS